MSLVAILFAFLTGFSFLSMITRKLRAVEYLGLSFPVGMGVITLCMFFIQLFTPITTSLLLVVVGVLAVAFQYKIFLDRNYIGSFTLWKKPEFLSVGKWNAIWLICFGYLLYLIYGITVKSLFWPTNARDAITSFDLFAKAIAHEGVLINSLIHEKSVGFGAAYPPLYALSLAYSYLFGFESSKIIPALMAISTAIGFYALTIRVSSKTAAIIGTLLLFMTPEFLAQSAVNITNNTHAFYAALGIIAFAVWYKTKEQQYFTISIILLAFNCWIRSEGIVFVGAVGLSALIMMIKKEITWKTVASISFALLPFIFWQFFLKANSSLMEDFTQVTIAKGFTWDSDKIDTFFSITKTNLFEGTYFGITVYVFMIAIVANVKQHLKLSTDSYVLIMLFMAWGAYLFLLYQIELKQDSIENVLLYSYKRFLFCFIILMWYYFSSNQMLNLGFKKIENFLKTPLDK